MTNETTNENVDLFVVGCYECYNRSTVSNLRADLRADGKKLIIKRTDTNPLFRAEAADFNVAKPFIVYNGKATRLSDFLKKKLNSKTIKVKDESEEVAIEVNKSETGNEIN